MDTNIAEKVERYNEIGQVVRVTLRWRGKIYYLQMFFPGSKFPSRGEVETQVKKIYPDCLLYTSPSPRDTERSRMPSSA